MVGTMTVIEIHSSIRSDLIQEDAVKGRKTTTSPKKPAAAPKAAPATEGCCGCSSSNAVMPINSEERYRLIREAAYFIAQKDGFKAGKELEYWVKGEAQINAMLAKK